MVILTVASSGPLSSQLLREYAMSNPYSVSTPSQSYTGAVPPNSSPTDGRPTGVTVFAVLCFVVSGLGVFGLLGTIVLLFADQPGAASSPVLELCRTNQFYFLFTAATTLLGAVVLVVLFMAGLRLWKMSPLGRKLILIYAVYAIIAAIASNAVNFVYLLPVMKRQMNAQSAGSPPGVQQIIEVSAMFGIVAGMVLALAFPVAIIWYFNRPEIKARLTTA